jgi:hypothetical protein
MRKSTPLRWIQEAEAREVLLVALSEQSPSHPPQDRTSRIALWVAWPFRWIFRCPYGAQAPPGAAGFQSEPWTSPSDPRPGEPSGGLFERFVVAAGCAAAPLRSVSRITQRKESPSNRGKILS